MNVPYNTSLNADAPATARRVRSAVPVPSIRNAVADSNLAKDPS